MPIGLSERIISMRLPLNVQQHVTLFGVHGKVYLENLVLETAMTMLAYLLVLRA